MTGNNVQDYSLESLQKLKDRNLIELLFSDEEERRDIWRSMREAVLMSNLFPGSDIEENYQKYYQAEESLRKLGVSEIYLKRIVKPNGYENWRNLK